MAKDSIFNPFKEEAKKESPKAEVNPDNYPDYGEYLAAKKKSKKEDK